MAENLARRVIDVVVERPVGVCDLGGAVVALGGAKQFRLSSAGGLRFAFGQDRWPGRGALAVTLAGGRLLLVEQVDRPVTAIEQDLAELGIGRDDLDPGLLLFLAGFPIPGAACLPIACGSGPAGDRGRGFGFGGAFSRWNGGLFKRG